VSSLGLHRLGRAHVVALALAGGVAALVAGACAAVPASTDTLTVNGPSLADFGGTGGVSAVLERNCGSLDCHGSDARPLRIYSQYGLRKPLNLITVVEEDSGGGGEGGAPVSDTGDDDAGPPVTGGDPTTPEEVLANYQAVVGLEPRVMQAVVKGADPHQLLLLKKPLQIESHKGGPALHPSGDGENCLVTWLQNKTDRTACGNASKLP
jgi:hypothetical protein